MSWLVDVQQAGCHDLPPDERRSVLDRLQQHSSADIAAGICSHGESVLSIKVKSLSSLQR